MRSSVLALLLSLACSTANVRAQEEAGVVVTFADGSSLPLTSWSLSYEYQAFRAGAAPALAAPSRRESRDLLVGKKVLATAGGALEIQYREYQRMSGGEDPQSEKVAFATGLVFTTAGKKRSLSIEAPHKDLLVPAGVEKGMTVHARALDLTGLTLTGTKRSFCLLAYMPQVECNPPAADRVARIEFQR
jgi:hypothetical protein